MTQLPSDEITALPVLQAFNDKHFDIADGTIVLELGNKKNGTGLYRDWYIDHGLQYICLDWNGEDGALVYDMRQLIQPEEIKRMGGPFNLVTNFGFSEHVDDQQACWRNIHNLVAFGGYLSICMPMMPEWKGHGLWMPTAAWYPEFAKLNGYEFVSGLRFWERVRPTIVCCLHKTGSCDLFEMPVGMIDRSTK